MNYEDKMIKCQQFFNDLCNLLSGSYTKVGSCNKDSSMYLVPLGTEDEITYYGKPQKSFRISDHWNWYANLSKCSNERYIQCWSIDVPYVRPRIKEGKASKPRKAIQVAIVTNNGKYRAIYGEKWNKKKKRWEWLDTNPEAALYLI